MRLVFLGTSGAVPSATRDTTSLALVDTAAAVLIDCGGSPVQKLRRSGVDPVRLTHVVITHIHPDHAYGLPSLVQTLHLLGRTAPLPVFCPDEHVDALGRRLDAFRLRDRADRFRVALEGISAAEKVAVLTCSSFTLSASRNDHGAMPNVALRIDGLPRGAVVYSSDTRPCEAVVRLATGAHTLIHEATFPHRARGRFGAHSTAAEAGEIAARAGVTRLLLTHIDAEYHGELDALADEARSRFGGTVEIADELVPYEL